MQKFQIVLLVSLISFIVCDPQLTSWIKSTGYNGYNNILTNVNTIRYSTSFVYISSSSVPSYSVGPWNANPNKPSDQNFVYKIRRVPVVSTTKTETRLGPIGTWTNGVAMYNAYDGMTYLNQGVWRRNAYFWEGVSFDSCFGHPDQRGVYHNHVHPKCLYDSTDSSKHSPIIGWAFDGYPIYGPYGYNSAIDPTYGVRKLKSSYRTRSITKRTTFPNGTAVAAAYYGPDVSTQYPIGAFLEDFEYVKGYGDLDEYNGRFAVTPEYPSGTYAYYATLDASGNPEFPFNVGLSYYAVPVLPNPGAIETNLVTYYSYSTTGK